VHGRCKTACLPAARSLDGIRPPSGSIATDREQPGTPRPADTAARPGAARAPGHPQPGIRAISASRSSATPRTAVRSDSQLPAPLRSMPRHGPCAGDVVRVRTVEEILKTLDGDGRLEGVPLCQRCFASVGRSFGYALVHTRYATRSTGSRSGGWTTLFTSPSSDVTARLTATVRPGRLPSLLERGVASSGRAAAQ
jgi:hypothetical protein